MKHDKICYSIEQRLRNMGLFTRSCEKYQTLDFEGECDVYGIDFKHQTIFAIEVKTRDTPMHYLKARQQLDKDEIFMREEYKNLKNLKFIKMYAFSSNKHRGYDIIKIK